MSIQQTELRDVIAGCLTPVARPLSLLLEPLEDDVAAIVRSHGATVDPVEAGACFNTSSGRTEAKEGEWVWLKATTEQAESLLKAL